MRHWVSVTIAALLVSASAWAQEIDNIRPSTTGIPGETLLGGGYDSEGRLWYFAR